MKSILSSPKFQKLMHRWLLLVSSVALSSMLYALLRMVGISFGASLAISTVLITVFLLTPYIGINPSPKPIGESEDTSFRTITNIIYYVNLLKGSFYTLVRLCIPIIIITCIAWIFSIPLPRDIQTIAGNKSIGIDLVEVFQRGDEVSVAVCSSAAYTQIESANGQLLLTQTHDSGDSQCRKFPSIPVASLAVSETTSIVIRTSNTNANTDFLGASVYHITRTSNGLSVTSEDIIETTTIATSELEQDLLAINVLLTGPESSPEQVAQVRGYLRSAGYQALAKNILDIMRDRKFKRPVHLDTINGKYIRLVDPSPDTIPDNQYGNVETLQRAILEHWNEQRDYPEATSFDDIVEPSP